MSSREEWVTHNAADMDPLGNLLRLRSRTSPSIPKLCSGSGQCGIAAMGWEDGYLTTLELPLSLHPSRKHLGMLPSGYRRPTRMSCCCDGNWYPSRIGQLPSNWQAATLSTCTARTADYGMHLLH